MELITKTIQNHDKYKKNLKSIQRSGKNNKQKTWKKLVKNFNERQKLFYGTLRKPRGIQEHRIK